VTAVIETYSTEDTYLCGEQFGKQSNSGDLYALMGDLGVGKTVFAQGFAAGLLIQEPIVSPTFTILHIYEQGRLSFYHFDCYRIIDDSEMEDLGYEEYFYGNGVCLVEWSEQIRSLLPENTRFVSIKKDLSKGENYRLIQVTDTVMHPVQRKANVEG
jgi:tRNA threonylcarbamoyladenosine biosynthesis protein TsaE